MDQFAVTMLVLIIGVALNTVLGVAATAAAVIGKIRVWVHPRLQSTLHGDLRRAARQESRFPGFNHAIFVVGTALVFPLVGLGATLLAVLTVGLNREEAESSIGSLVGCIAIFAFPLAAIPGYAWLSARPRLGVPSPAEPGAVMDRLVSFYCKAPLRVQSSNSFFFLASSDLA
jgi:hypothetical protein